MMHIRLVYYSASFIVPCITIKCLRITAFPNRSPVTLMGVHISTAKGLLCNAAAMQCNANGTINEDSSLVVRFNFGSL